MKRSELDSVFQLILKEKTKAEIQKKLDLKPSALSNHLLKLENLGIIEREGKYIIKVLRSSLKHPRVTKNLRYKKLNKRGHAYNFKIIFPDEENLIEKPKVQNELKLKKIKKLKFGSLKLIKDKNSIWINKGSLTIYSSNSYYSKNSLHSKFRSLKDIDNLIIYLKDRFDFKGVYGIEVFREHYGLIFNKFAQWILSKGKKLYVKDNGNKTILWVDNSRKDDIGLKEFEGNDPKIINSADNYFKEHEETNFKVSPLFVLDGFKKVNKANLQAARNINYYGKNQVTHVKLMKNIDKNLEKQTTFFENMTKLLKEKEKRLK